MQDFIKRNSTFLLFLVIVGLTSFYLFPLFQGLILLPLDLLVANHNPWYYQAAIYIKNSFMEDSVIQMYPWRWFVFESLQQGEIPFLESVYIDGYAISCKHETDGILSINTSSFSFWSTSWMEYFTFFTNSALIVF